MTFKFTCNSTFSSSVCVCERERLKILFQPFIRFLNSYGRDRFALGYPSDDT